MTVTLRPEHPDDPLRPHGQRALHALTTVELGQIQPGFGHDGFDFFRALLHKDAYPQEGACVQCGRCGGEHASGTARMENEAAHARTQAHGLIRVLLSGKPAKFYKHASPPCPDAPGAGGTWGASRARRAAPGLPPSINAPPTKAAV